MDDDVKQRFDDVDRKFEEVDRRFDRVDVRLENLEAKVSNVQVRIEQVQGEVNVNRDTLLAELRKNREEDRAERRAFHAEQMRAFQAVIDEVRGERDQRLNDRFARLERQVEELQAALRNRGS